MPAFSVIRRSDSVEVHRYDAAAPIFDGYPDADFAHLEFVDGGPAPALDRPEDWYIGVGPFWDRFGVYKIPILASADAVVQAIIKDSSVRKYLDLQGRRADLLAALTVLQGKGFPLNATAILDTKPAEHEVHRG